MLPNNAICSEITISEVKVGMTLLVDGFMKTVGNKDIKYCPFMGVSIFGAAYPKTRTRVQFAVTRHGRLTKTL